MKTLKSVNYFTMKEYCETINDYVITYEKFSQFLNPEFNPRQEILSITQQQKTDDSRWFALLLFETVGVLVRQLHGIMPKHVHHLSWIGGKDEALGKQTFIDTMKIVWPELGL